MLLNLIRKTGGAAFIEFALLLPVLLLVLFSTYDVGTYIYAINKMNRTSSMVNDVIGRNSVTECELVSILQAAVSSSEPFNFTANGTIIATGAADVNDGNGVLVRWQKKSGGTAVSKIGTPGNTAKLPQGFTVSAGDTAIFVEVFYDFTPLFNIGVMSPTQIYRMTVSKPRLGQMLTLPAC